MAGGGVVGGSDWCCGNVIVVETEELIEQVRGKRCLWDNKHKNYVKRDFQRAGWLAVADAIKAPVPELKKRWRGLRDTYSRELRRLDVPPGLRPDAELAQRSAWRYFARLGFLRRVVGHNRAKRKADAPDDEDTRSDRSGRSSPEKDRCSDSKGSLAVLIKQEYENLNPADASAPPSRDEDAREMSANDADELFLRSLLPFLQEVPRHRKLLVRAQLLQVLMDDQHLNRYNDH